MREWSELVAGEEAHFVEFPVGHFHDEPAAGEVRPGDHLTSLAEQRPSPVQLPPSHDAKERASADRVDAERARRSGSSRPAGYATVSADQLCAIGGDETG